MKIAICPGSFDPITLGHLDIIQRAALMFDKVIVAVLVNPGKNPSFTAEERLGMIRRAVADIPNVEAECFDGLLADYVRMRNAHTIVKGLRAVTDFEYEFQMALINRKLNPGLDTMFLTAEHQYMFMSSSVIRELSRYDVDLSDFLPEQIIPDVREKNHLIDEGGK